MNSNAYIMEVQKVEELGLILYLINELFFKWWKADPKTNVGWKWEEFQKNG